MESIAESKFQKNLVGNLDFLSKILFVCLFVLRENELAMASNDTRFLF